MWDPTKQVTPSSLPSSLQYEFHMVLELIKKGHPDAERKVPGRDVWLPGVMSLGLKQVASPCIS